MNIQYTENNTYANVNCSVTAYLRVRNKLFKVLPAVQIIIHDVMNNNYDCQKPNVNVRCG